MSERSRYVCGHRLPALEAHVLELLLDAERPLAVAEVQAVLSGPRRAHTTVSTLLARLAERGLVKRRKRGRLYEWEPAGTREGLGVSALRHVLDRVDDPDAVVVGFLESVRGSRPRRSGRKEGRSGRRGRGG